MENSQDWTNQDTWAVYKAFQDLTDFKAEAKAHLDDMRPSVTHETQLVPHLKEFVDDTLAQDDEVEKLITNYMGHHPFSGHYQGFAVVNWAELIYRAFENSLPA